MKVGNEIEKFIKNNYSGSIINFEEDIDRFMALKRLFKKHSLKNIFIDSDRHLLMAVNQTKTLLNCFELPVINKIFIIILEPNELTIWFSFIYVLNFNNISYDKNLEKLLQPYFREYYV